MTRRPSFQASLVAMTAVCGILGLLVYQWFNRPDFDEPAAKAGQSATVTSVIDGDTFTAADSSGEDLGRLRVLGIDAPEMPRDGDPGDCHAIEATEAAAQLLDDTTVTVAHDPAQGEQDRYGRLLVYVDVAGNDFAQDMLNQGHARLYDDAGNLGRQDTYVEAEQNARGRDAGLWGSC